MRIVTTSSSSQLFGLTAGWNGPHRLDVSGADLAGGCAAARGGYVAGCGMRIRFDSGKGTATLAAGPGTLHLKVKSRSTGTTAYNGQFNGSVSFQVPSPDTWTAYLYPEAGQATNGASISFTWP